MSDEKSKYRLDKTAFQAMTFEEADNYQRDYRNYSVIQRLEIALYLTSIAYNFDINNPPKMDKTVFSKEKLH
jgi:hypothetical protein